MAETESAVPAFQPQRIVYCGVCTLPPEYCEFGGTKAKCEDWIKQHHPDLHARIYSEEAATAALSTLSVEARARAEKDDQKKAAKAARSEAAEATRRAEAKVIIKRVERNKRKYVTEVSGLEAHGLDLKKVAKDFGKKFATGSSVTKAPGGGDLIIVQGDVADEISEIVEGLGVPEGNIEVTEDKKKKGAGAAAAV